MGPKRKRPTTEVALEEPLLGVQVTGSTLASTPEEAHALIRRMSLRNKKRVVYTEEEVPDQQQLDDAFDGPLTDLDDEPVKEEETSPKKRNRRKKVDEPIVYDIPAVETKETTYKGRLGYACLNTVLRASKPDPIFCSRTLRIETILKPDYGMGYCKELGRKNAEDLARLIQWNEDNNIKFLRVSSEMFPFASHDKYGYTLEYAEKELRAAGDLAKKYGHRLTSHPGQFTQLGSPRDAVVTAALRDLEYHCQMFRLMGCDQDSVMIIHMGGMFGDKQATIERFKEVYQTKLTDEMRARLVLENDEMCYNADDLLPVCEELSIPLVFDYHHNWIYPSEKPLPELIKCINAIWQKKGIRPKQHLSEPCPGAESVTEKRKHANRCFTLPQELPEDMDLMIEAKDKEQAVLHLHRIYNLHAVIHANLRPEKPPKPFPRPSSGEGESEERDGRSPRERKIRRKEGGIAEVTEVMDLNVAEDSKDLAETEEADPAEITSSKGKGKGNVRKNAARKRARKNAKLEVEEEIECVPASASGTTGTSTHLMENAAAVSVPVVQPSHLPKTLIRQKKREID